MVKKRKKKKQPKLSTLKTKLDNVFSKYIRLRDADENGWSVCVTCGAPDHWKNQDAGHFISRGYLPTRFEETNVHTQCRYENRYRNGAPDEYALFIMKTYGESEYERLRKLKNSNVKLSVEDYKEKISYYNSKVLELESKLLT